MFAFVKELFLFLGCILIFYNKYFTVYLNVHCNEILSNRTAFSLLNILLLLLPKNIMIFPVVMYGCESWTVNKAECQIIDVFLTVVLEKTLENHLGCNGIQPVHSKEDQSWVFIGRTNAKAETPILPLI